LKFQAPPFIFLGERFAAALVNSKAPNFRICFISSIRFRAFVALFLLSAGLSSQVPSFAQTASQGAASARENAPKATPADEELQKRLRSAQDAQRTSNPVTVAAANQRLIALTLREMAHLRLMESAFAPAIELYQRSLDFEDLPDTRIDLAIAALQARRLDDSLAQSQKALLAEPGNARAYGVEGRAWMGKQEFTRAAEALEQATKLAPDFDTSYLLGMCLLQSKEQSDKDKAAAVFADIVRQTGDSGSLHVIFGRAYRDANDMPAAIREFQRAIALDPATPHAHYFLGLARLAGNEWKPTPEVRQEFSRELQKFPRDYLANYMTGFLASGDRNYAESDRYLKIAAEINPAWPEPWLYLGLNAYAQADMPRAEEYFRKAIQLTGKDEERSNFQIRRAYVDLGRILANSGRSEESEIYLAKARDLQNKTMVHTQQNVSEIALAGGAGSAAAIMPLSPKNEVEAAPLEQTSVDPFAHLDASVLARANLTETERAQAEAQEARLRAILGLSFNDLATSEAVRRDYLAALTHYQEAEHWDATIPGLLKNLGLAAFRAANYPEAVRALSVALAEKPDQAPIRAILGMAYFAGDNFAQAQKTFAPLGERGMQDATVGYAWAVSAARTGDLKQAGQILAQFENSTLPNETLLLVGQLWIEIGDYSHALDTLHRLSNADPSFLKAHYFAGQADIRSEHWPEAAQEFQAELALAPADMDAKYNLGFVLVQQSKTAEAFPLFQEVISANPAHANAQYQLGKILLDRGQLKDAIDHLEIAARLSPQTDYVHYQLQSAYRRESRIAEADREMELYKQLKAKQRERANTLPQSP
jgi:tetratricopeptide (TPR) repeat protein